VRHERDLIEALRAGAFQAAEGFNVGRLIPYRTDEALAVP
jgi:hypothetical protein